jgi:hypothetical protein
MPLAGVIVAACSVARLVATVRESESALAQAVRESAREDES